MDNGSRLAGIAVVVLMFAAGVFAGILFERVALAPARAPQQQGGQQQQTGQQPQGQGGQHGAGQGGQQVALPDDARSNYVNTLDRELDLSDEQVTDLQELLTANEEKFITIHATARASMVDLDKELFESIFDLCNDTQRERFLQIWRSPFAPPPQAGGGFPPPPGAPGHNPPPGMPGHIPPAGAPHPGMGPQGGHPQGVHPQGAPPAGTNPQGSGGQQRPAPPANSQGTPQQ